jgi:hypothetical protein
MDLPFEINRSARVLASAVALAGAFVSSNAVSGPTVTVDNVPLPVTGSVSATVSGSVNANVTNAVLPVTGTVGVSSLPAVQVSSLPAVSLTIPAQPFFNEINLITNDAKAVGVVNQTLAVTTLTISNFDSNQQQLFVFAGVMSAPNTCSGSVIGGGTPIARALLDPRKTVQLQFPTPMVFTQIAGASCIAAEVTTILTGGSVTVDVVGFAAP